MSAQYLDILPSVSTRCISISAHPTPPHISLRIDVISYPLSPLKPSHHREPCAVHRETQLHPTKKVYCLLFPSRSISTSLPFSSTLAELPSTWYQSSPPPPLPTQQDKTKFQINPPLYILPEYKLIKPGPKLD